MKLPILAVAMSLSVCMMAQTTEVNSPQVFHASGSFADMRASPIPNGSVWVYASHSDRPETATFLQFDIFILNPDGSFTDTFGVGDVPESSLSGNNTKSLSLNVDTSQVSSFETTTCTSNGVCHQGPFGLVQIDFTADGDFTFESVGEAHYEFVQVAERQHFDFRSASALAHGSILGNFLNNGSCEIGKNRRTFITINRKR